jgi:hypothetical protein
MEKELFHKVLIDGVEVDVKFKDGKLSVEFDASADKAIDLVEKLIPGDYEKLILEPIRGYLKA